MVCVQLAIKKAPVIGAYINLMLDSPGVSDASVGQISLCVTRIGLSWGCVGLTSVGQGLLQVPGSLFRSLLEVVPFVSQSHVRSRG